MRPNDIFEAFTDIDDKFIAAAHPAEYDDGQPVVVQPAPKKSLWKTLVPTAACLAVLCTAGTFGARYFLTRPNAETSDPYTSSNGYTSEAVTDINSMDYRAGLKEIKINAADEQKYFGMEEFPEYRFGAFNTGVVMFSMDLGIETTALIDGEVQDLCLCDLNGDGKRELCATVLRSGKNSVEVVDFANNKFYTTQFISNEQCGLIVRNGELALVERGFDTVTTSFPFSLDKLTQIIPFAEETVSLVDRPAEFVMEELPDKYFVFKNSAVYMCDSSAAVNAMLKKIMDADMIYLADLNGDGRRELVTCSGMNTDTVSDYDHRKYITIYDIENDETYFNYFDDVKVEFANDGIVLTKYNAQTDTGNPLTLDMLEKLTQPEFEEVCLEVDRNFTLPDFEGFWFTVNTVDHPEFRFRWEDKRVDNAPYRVYLCDLDGDGRREIAMNCPDNDGCIKVYGFMEHGEFGEAVYYEKGGCRLAESRGTLVYETLGGKQKPFEFLSSDLSPNFLQVYYFNITDKDFTVDFSDILPWSGKYRFEIAENSLSIYRNDELSTEMLTDLDELYAIPNREDGTLILVCTFEDIDNINAIKVMEDSVDVIVFDPKYTLKRSENALYLVDEDGSEVPFRFSEEFAAQSADS